MFASSEMDITLKTSLHKSALNAIRSILDGYFRSRTSASLKKNIQDWLGENRFEEEKDEVLKEIWDECVGEQEPDSYAKASLEQLRKRLGFQTPEPAKKTPLLRWKTVLWRSAAAGVLLIGVTGTWFFVNEAEQSKQMIEPHKNRLVAGTRLRMVATGDQERKQVVLPDGSQVWLDENSRIVYPSDFVEKRSVELDGEARFSVVKQNGEPFTVQGADLHITVLGTEFLFDSRKGKAVSEVRLIKGSVDVRHSGEEVWRMKPNDLLTHDRETDDIRIQQLTVVETAPEPDLNFESASLEEVIRRLSDRFEVIFIVDERIPLWMTVTAKFNEHESLEDILFVIASTTGVFNYTTAGDEVYLTRH